MPEGEPTRRWVKCVNCKGSTRDPRPGKGGDPCPECNGDGGCHRCSKCGFPAKTYEWCPCKG